MENIKWTCGESNWSQLVTGGANWLWMVALLLHILDWIGNFYTDKIGISFWVPL